MILLNYIGLQAITDTYNNIETNYDELERKLPKEILPFSNGKETIILDGDNHSLQSSFKKSWEEQTNLLRKAVQKYGWGYLPLKTDSDYMKLFTEFCLG